MRVPAALGRALPADAVGKIDRHEFRPRLDEPPREQAALPVSRAAVCIAHLLRLGGNIERIAQLRRLEHRHRLPVIAVESARARRAIHHARLRIHELLQFAPSLHPLDRDTLGQAEFRE